jgi:hypothetical protein
MKGMILPRPAMVRPNKILLVLAVVIVAAGMAWARDGKFGEINLKAAYQFEGLVRDHTNWMDYGIYSFYPTDPGFSFGAEYLYSLFNQTLKIGAGLQYELPRIAWAHDAEGEKENERVKYSLLPIYATIQYHPIKNFQELFIKANVGFNLLTSIELIPEKTSMPLLDEKKGGLYWQASVGFELAWGLVLDCFYSQKYARAIWEMTGFDSATDDYRIRDFGLSIGYKIKL